MRVGKVINGTINIIDDIVKKSESILFLGPPGVGKTTMLREVDFYMGGSEHATGHLLYSRFWQKVLFDLGYVRTDEYAKKLVNQGMILGNSAFVYRNKGTQTYLSKGMITENEVEPIRVDVSLVNTHDELNLEGLKNWQKDFQNAEFILENGRNTSSRVLLQYTIQVRLV